MRRNALLGFASGLESSVVVGNLSLALADASSGSARLFDRRRVAFWAIGALAMVILAACLTLDPLTEILRFSAPSALQLLCSVLIGVAAGGWFRLARGFRASSPATR